MYICKKQIQEVETQINNLYEKLSPWFLPDQVSYIISNRDLNPNQQKRIKPQPQTFFNSFTRWFNKNPQYDVSLKELVASPEDQKAGFNQELKDWVDNINYTGDIRSYIVEIQKNNACYSIRTQLQIREILTNYDNHNGIPREGGKKSNKKRKTSKKRKTNKKRNANKKNQKKTPNSIY